MNLTKEASTIRRTGFIAQEVEKAAMATSYDFSDIVKPKSEKEHYGLSYESFVVPLVKAMQEQQQMIDYQNQKITQLQEQKKIIDAQNKKIEQLNEQLMREKEELLNVKTQLAELKKLVERLN